jgi:hypothetical protein
MTLDTGRQGNTVTTSKRDALRLGIDVVAAAACGLAALLTLANIHTPIRAGLTIVALILGTGWAATCWITVKDTAFAATIVIAAGLSIVCFYALLFVEIHWWHPVGSIGALLIVAAGVNVLAIVRDLLRGTRP